MKTLQRGLIFTLLVFGVQQIKAQQSLNATSHSQTIDGKEHAYTLGDMVLVQTIQQSGLIVTQGYFQPFSLNKVSQSATQQEFFHAVKVYPNPTSQQLWIEVVDDQFNKLQYSLTDMNGKRIFNGVSNSSSKKVSLNLNQLSNGLYNLSIQLNEQHVSYTIQKNN